MDESDTDEETLRDAHGDASEIVKEKYNALLKLAFMK